MRHACLLCLLTCGVFGQELRIETLHAVEESNSALGAYRLVFSLSAPLPAPRGAGFRPRISLDGAELELCGDPGPLLFGYCDTLPQGRAMLRVGDPFQPLEEQPGLLVAPRELLSDAPRGYEAAHIQRSPGGAPLDLLAAWEQTGAPHDGRLVRGEAEEEGWRLFFQPPGAGEALELHSSRPLADFELGARYLVFHDAGQVHAAVRVWWPRSDPVLGLVKLLSSVRAPQLQQPAVQRQLVAALRSPAAELRYTAAVALRRAPGRAKLLREVPLRELLEQEPHAAVQAALRELVSAD